jgi:hypothetical protein
MLKGSFAESSSGVIELEEDDSYTVDVMLQYFYGFYYRNLPVPDKEEMHPCEFHIKVAVTANKYGTEELQKEAMREARYSARNLYSTHEVFRTLQMLTHYEDHLEDVQALGQDLVNSHLYSLVKLKDFRTWLVEHENYVPA